LPLIASREALQTAISDPAISFENVKSIDSLQDVKHFTSERRRPLFFF